MTEEQLEQDYPDGDGGRGIITYLTQNSRSVGPEPQGASGRGGSYTANGYGRNIDDERLKAMSPYSEQPPPYSPPGPEYLATTGGTGEGSTSSAAAAGKSVLLLY